MHLVGRKVSVALRDAPLVPSDWGRQLGVPVVVVGSVSEQSEHGFVVDPVELVHLNNGTKIERDKDEIPYRAILVPWLSVSSVAVH
jgi:hypothetical protein